MDISTIKTSSCASQPTALIMGLGRFGGGVGAAKYLYSKGYKVLVTDLNTNEHLKDSIEALSALDNISFRLGEHFPEDFTKADIVVVNPAVKPDNNKYIKIAIENSAIVTSAIQLLVEKLPNKKKVIGVTGSAGKSTVSAMIAHILKHTISKENKKEKVFLGGNFGGSLLGDINTIGKNDWVVLELSSFMLYWLYNSCWSPHIAVITNIYPNHLDWHQSYQKYIEAKNTITKFQSINDIAVMRKCDSNLFIDNAGQTNQQINLIDDKQEVINSNTSQYKLQIPGKHNNINAKFAVSAVKYAGIEEKEACLALQTFNGLAHRLQFVKEYKGIKFFNDSKSTTPQAAILAMDSFAPKKVHLILGGYDKGSDFKELAHYAVSRCVGIYCLGATGPTIAKLAYAAKEKVKSYINSKNSDTKIKEADDLPGAITLAYNTAKAGEVIVLSPACASWDQFENFEQRGNLFIDFVNKLLSE